MKDIKDFEGLYTIDTFGNITSYHRGAVRPLKTYISGNGYLLATLTKDGKQEKHYVHRLVAQAFLPNPKDLPCINHLDEDKTNPTLSNLEWTTHLENCEYTTAKHYTFLSPSQIVVEVFNLRKFCREHSLNNGCMSLVSSGKAKHHKGWTLYS